jgi:type IV pilus assembly protein PilB
MSIVPPSQRNAMLYDTPELKAAAAKARDSAPRRRRIGEVLVNSGVISAEQLDQALAEQGAVPAGTPRRRVGSVIVDMGFATEAQVAQALARALGFELVDLSRTPMSPEAARLVPRDMAEREGLLVLQQNGKQITVAVSDPTNLLALDDVRFHTGAGNLRIVIATNTQVHEQLRRAWTLADNNDVASLFDAEVIAAALPTETDADKAAATAPIVRLVDVIFKDAAASRASDIHIEPQANALRVRFRIDGVLRDVMTVPRTAAPAVASRIKIVAGLDISEKRKPQDGRARLSLDGIPLDARVSTLPSLHGEKIVIRLLSRGEDIPALAKSGMEPAQLDLLMAALEAPQGLILITGPTGSGKTNTLYAAIQATLSPERNIITLEDPVEVQFPGITQVQINVKAGMTFATGLRSVLRQDPDVVLVGETRDTETAELSLQASLTGHLVLTTLHTNDAVRAITRIVDMGIEPFLVASSLTLVVAQRLVRRICPDCSVPHRPSDEVLALLGLTEHELVGSAPRVGAGCTNCSGSGYKGRTGIFEVLPVTAGLRAVLLENPTESALSAVAQAEGVATLRMSALSAARRGITTYEEVLRVTHVDAVDPSSGTHCHACTRQVAPDMAFCPWCRTALTRPSCSGCGNRLEPRWQGCPACGTQVPVGAARPPLSDVLPATPLFVLPPAPSAPPAAPPANFLQAGPKPAFTATPAAVAPPAPSAAATAAPAPGLSLAPGTSATPAAPTDIASLLSWPKETATAPTSQARTWDALTA